MICEYCHGEGWHHPRCPLYEEKNLSITALFVKKEFTMEKNIL